MRCSACSAKVQGALSSLESFQTVEVDHQRDCAIVSAAVALSEDEIRLVLSQVGGFTLEEMKAEYGPVRSDCWSPVDHGESDASTEEAPPQSLFPLFLIVGYIFTVTLLIAWSNSQWSMDSMMRHFMAGFFLVFSFFKFLDAPGFASAFKMYDPLADHSRLVLDLSIRRIAPWRRVRHVLATTGDECNDSCIDVRWWGGCLAISSAEAHHPVCLFGDCVESSDDQGHAGRKWNHGGDGGLHAGWVRFPMPNALLLRWELKRNLTAGIGDGS